MVAASHTVGIRVEFKHSVKYFYPSHGMFKGYGVNPAPLPLLTIFAVPGSEGIERRTYAAGNDGLQALLFRCVDIVNPSIRPLLHQSVEIEVVLSAQCCSIELIQLITQELVCHLHADELKKRRGHKRSIHRVVPYPQLLNRFPFRFAGIAECLSPLQYHRGKHLRIG